MLNRRCDKCQSLLASLHGHYAPEFFRESETDRIWDITHAKRLINLAPRSTVFVGAKILAEMEKVEHDLNDPHIDHVDTYIPSILSADGKIIIEGNHRALQAVKRKLGLTCYQLTQEEENDCLRLGKEQKQLVDSFMPVKK